MCLNWTSYDVQYSILRLNLTKHGTRRHNVVMFSLQDIASCLSFQRLSKRQLLTGIEIAKRTFAFL